jgi:hypothetical protein
LADLDAVTRIIDPATEPEAIRPKVPRNRCEWFGRGELFRLAMDTLRNAPEPLSALEIARAVVARKGLDDAGPYVLRRVTGMVDAMLRRREGLAERIVYGGDRWGGRWQPREPAASAGLGR